jgi:abortive infection bacteriophage resistance protein
VRPSRAAAPRPFACPSTGLTCRCLNCAGSSLPTAPAWSRARSTTRAGCIFPICQLRSGRPADEWTPPLAGEVQARDLLLLPSILEFPGTALAFQAVFAYLIRQRTRPASQRCAYGRVFLVRLLPSLRTPFVKPPLSVPDQLQRLASRGLIISDPSTAAHYLTHIGYYRLSGYTRAFQKDVSGLGLPEFRPGTTFEDVLDRYVFDRKLRLLVMDAVERIEVSIRAALSNAIATHHGAHWYMEAKLFGTGLAHTSLIADIKSEIGHDKGSNRRDIYIQHYYDRYSDPELPPCWMVFESLSFGTISMIYQHLAHPEFDNICKPLGLNHAILGSWLHSISYIRNLCAHHSRLWNRLCRIKPVAAKAYKPDLTPNDRLYAQLVVMQILLRKIAPDNRWAERLMTLLDEHPKVPILSMGIPGDWRSRAIWEWKA